MENNKDKFSHKVGDAVERVGQKVTDLGAPKVGNRIAEAGDRIEHSQDNETVSPSKEDL